MNHNNSKISMESPLYCVAKGNHAHYHKFFVVVDTVTIIIRSDLNFPAKQGHLLKEGESAGTQ